MSVQTHVPRDWEEIADLKLNVQIAVDEVIQEYLKPLGSSSYIWCLDLLRAAEENPKVMEDLRFILAGMYHIALSDGMLVGKNIWKS